MTEEFVDALCDQYPDCRFLLLSVSHSERAEYAQFNDHIGAARQGRAAAGLPEPTAQAHSGLPVSLLKKTANPCPIAAKT
jgi:hypothetical protein